MPYFTSDEDYWIDSADFVFYSGHGNINGWQCVEREWFDKTQTSVLYGERNLKWITLNSCDVLKDKSFTKNDQDDVFAWAKIFGGLHMLLGYGTPVDSRTDVGRKFVELMDVRNPIIYSWFKTAKITQNNDQTIACVLYSYNDTIDPYNECIPGRGTVTASIQSPKKFKFAYSPC